MTTMWAFHGILREALWFQNVIHAAACNVSSAIVCFSSEGIAWRAMPATKITMLAVKIKLDAFAECTLSAAPFEVGIKLWDMLKMMRALRAKVGDQLLLRVDSTTSQIEMSITVGGRCSRVLMYSVSLDSVADEPPVGAEAAMGDFPYEVPLQSDKVHSILAEIAAVDGACLRFSVRRGICDRIFLGAESCGLLQNADADSHSVQTEKVVQRVSGIVGMPEGKAKFAKRRGPVLKHALVASFMKGRKCCNRIKVVYAHLFVRIKIMSACASDCVVWIQ